jgi:hypothetical protein
MKKPLKKFYSNKNNFTTTKPIIVNQITTNVDRLLKEEIELNQRIVFKAKNDPLLISIFKRDGFVDDGSE